jgi:UDP-glucose 6-dehydrogenase
MRIAIFSSGCPGTAAADGSASEGHDWCDVDVESQKLDCVVSDRTRLVEPHIGNVIAAGYLVAIVDLRKRLGAEIARLGGREGIGPAA